LRDTIRLGLNIPLFVASMIAIAIGTFTGIVGIWGYAAQKQVVPEWIKVGHAHASWWAVLILIAATEGL
jgi:acyl CoA:acetate/3-ketoacid CoA transferase beta subunit